MAEEKHSQRKESIRFSKSGRNHKAAAAAVLSSGILEAIAKFSGGGDQSAATRLKIVVKREDLQQVLEAIRDGRRANSAAPPVAVSLEQRLNLMRRRQVLRATSQLKLGKIGDLWRPVLQSIPEEL